MSYAPFNEATASTEDRIAWVLCQIIDDDAPMRWTRYRFAAGCIATNKALMADLKRLAVELKPPTAGGESSDTPPATRKLDELHQIDQDLNK